MTEAVQPQPQIEVTDEMMEKLLLSGDYSGLSARLQAQFLWILAKKKGLDPMTQPFQFIPNAKGKLILYATKNCALQIKQKHGIVLMKEYSGALRLTPQQWDVGVYEVEMKAVNAEGAILAWDIGTAELENLTGRERKDAPMKAWTRAERRTLLKVEGLGIPDESELDFVPSRERQEAPPTAARVLPPQTSPSMPPTNSTEAVSKISSAPVEIVMDLPRTIQPKSSLPVGRTLGKKLPPVMPPVIVPKS